MTTPLSKGANAPLPDGPIQVEVRAGATVDISALLVTVTGKVRSDDDFIFYNQPTGPGVQYAQTGVTVTPSQVPAEIEKVVMTASLDGSGPATFGQVGQFSLVASSGGSEIVSFTPDGLSSETALVCVEIYRRQGAWKIRAVGQGWANGLAGIATEFGISVDDEPAAPAAAPASPPPTPSPSPAAPPPAHPQGELVAPPPGQTPVHVPHGPSGDPPPPLTPPPLASAGGGQAPVATMAPPQAAPAPPPPATQTAPAAAATGRVNLDKGRVSLQKRQTVSLVKTGAPPLNAVFMGLGWDPAKRGKSIDLDASVLALDSSGRKLEIVYFGHKDEFNGAIHHTGDNLTGDGGGDDEVINVDLNRIPPHVEVLVFTVNSYRGQKFTDVKKAYCRLVDRSSNQELVRFELSDSEKSTGVIMAAMHRSGATWSMTAVGEFHDGKTAKNMVGPAEHMWQNLRGTV